MALNSKQPPFWIVWNPNGQKPTFKYGSQEGALREAERLAKTNPEETFVVLEAVCAFQCPAMLRIDLRAEAL